MIRPELINPKSIVIVGASNNVQKPGEKILKNILDHKYKGPVSYTHLDVYKRQA